MCFRPRCAAPLFVLVLAFLGGCRAERHLVFVTEPAGAQVVLDGEFVGRTPLDLSFEIYGYRHVAFHKAGYRSHSEVLEIESPWYSIFPLDFITEIFLPFGWKDIHRLEVVLERHTGEVTQPDFDAVLERAESLRRAGPEGPVKPAPTPEAKSPAVEADDGK